MATTRYHLERAIDAPNSDEAVIDIDKLLPPEYFARVPDSGGGWFKAVSLVGRVTGA